MDETGWVIERGDSEPSAPTYWAGLDMWSQDHMDAIRFARKRDAERISARMTYPNNRVCEHIWTGPLSAPAGEAEPYAWVVENSDNGNAILWSRSRDDIERLRVTYPYATITPVYTAPAGEAGWRTAFDEMLAALKVYEAFHEHMFCTGRPLEQAGKPINHADFNHAHLLASAAIAKAEALPTGASINEHAPNMAGHSEK